MWMWTAFQCTASIAPESQKKPQPKDRFTFTFLMNCSYCLYPAPELDATPGKNTCIFMTGLLKMALPAEKHKPFQ